MVHSLEPHRGAVQLINGTVADVRCQQRQGDGVALVLGLGNPEALDAVLVVEIIRGHVRPGSTAPGAENIGKTGRAPGVAGGGPAGQTAVIGTPLVHRRPRRCRRHRRHATSVAPSFELICRHDDSHRHARTVLRSRSRHRGTTTAAETPAIGLRRESPAGDYDTTCMSIADPCEI